MMNRRKVARELLRIAEMLTAEPGEMYPTDPNAVPLVKGPWKSDKFKKPVQEPTMPWFSGFDGDTVLRDRRTIAMTKLIAKINTALKDMSNIDNLRSRRMNAWELYNPMKDLLAVLPAAMKVLEERISHYPRPEETLTLDY